MRGASLALALVVAGCGDPSTVLLTIEDPTASGPLSLSLFDPLGPLVAGRGLPGPGRVVIQNVPAPEALRIAVVAPAAGTAAGASARVDTVAGEQVSARLVLGPFADLDGDRVPDGIDNCETGANPEQEDRDRDGVGNACDGTTRGDAAMPIDLAVPVDLAGVDLVGRDLTPPIDLAPTADLAPAPCPAGAKLCEGFETGAVDTVRWPTKYEQSPSSTITVSSLRAHTGSFSLRAHFAANGATARSLDAQLVNFNGFPADPTFVRAWVYFDGQPRFSSGVTLANIQQTGNPYGGFTFYLVGPYVGVNAYNFSFSAGNNAVDPDGVANPYSRWVCFEWQVTNSGGGQLKTFVDGVARPTADTTFAAQTLGMGQLVLGAEGTVAANAPAFDVYFDDVVIATLRVGCN